MMQKRFKQLISFKQKNVCVLSNHQPLTLSTWY